MDMFSEWKIADYDCRHWNRVQLDVGEGTDHVESGMKTQRN
jgi:hypothetical protein